MDHFHETEPDFDQVEGMLNDESFFGLEMFIVNQIISQSGIIKISTAQKLINKFIEVRGDDAILLLKSIDCGNIGNKSLQLLKPFSHFPLIGELFDASHRSNNLQLEEENDDLRKRVKEMDEIIYNLQLQLKNNDHNDATLKCSCDNEEIKDLQNRLADMQQINEMLSEQLQSGVSPARGGSGSDEEASSLYTQLNYYKEALDKTIEESNIEKDKLRYDIQILQGIVDASETAKDGRELIKLREDNEQLKREINLMKSRLDADNNSKIRDELEQTKKDLAERETYISSFVTSNLALQETIENINAQRDEELELFKAQLMEAKQEYQNLNVTYMQMKSQLSKEIEELKLKSAK